MRLLSFLLLVLLSSAFAKTAPAQTVYAAPEDRHATPLATVQELFDAMRAADSARLKAVFHREATMASMGDDGALAVMDTRKFIRSIGELDVDVADEQLGRADVHIDGALANVWVPYRFYSGGAFSHCGTNVFTLIQAADQQWSILRTIDTRHLSGCPPLNDDANIAALDTIMNAWHHAAAVADSATFFGTYANGGIYLGTDATERWTRDEMAYWAKDIFKRDTAWAFTPRQRHWELSDDGQTAWFDEHLDSWMGVVRGSGVLTQKTVLDDTGRAWELRHYNLSLAVPNERMDAVRLAIDSTAVMRD